MLHGVKTKTIFHTYKAITRPILNNTCSTWTPVILHTNFNHLQVIQNPIACIAVGQTANLNSNIENQEVELLSIKPYT